jgi:hypothetical protein
MLTLMQVTFILVSNIFSIETFLIIHWRRSSVLNSAYHINIINCQEYLLSFVYHYSFSLSDVRSYYYN